MREILSKSIEAKLKDKDKYILKSYWTLIHGDEFADSLVFDPNDKPPKKKKSEKDDRG